MFRGGIALARLPPMMTLPLLCLPLLFAHSASLASGPASSHPASSAAKPAAAPAFSEAVTQRAEAGWHLRDVQTTERPEGLVLSLTLAGQRRAERLSLTYDLGEQRFGRFARKPVLVPEEEREYQSESMLFEELSLGPPRAVSYDCADFYLDFGSRAVSLSDAAFEVEVVSTDDRPGAALGAWLSELLAAGELVDVRDERWDDGAEVRAEVVFAIDSDQGPMELRAELSQEGEVIFVSMHHTPGRSIWRRYVHSRELQQVLAKGRGVTRLGFVGGDSAQTLRLQVELAGDLHLSLDLGDFEPDGQDCGC